MLKETYTMKQLTIACLFIFSLSSNILAQKIDTLINVGDGHQLHFAIIKGKNPPILFEAGFGNYADVWKDIATRIASATDATIITYDRLSNGDDKRNYLISLEEETKCLEAGLEKLGYSKNDIMLVAHSLGGMYSSYYAARHPNEVKAAVFIDAASVCSLNSHPQDAKLIEHDTIEQFILKITDAVSRNPMPLGIPMTDIVAEIHYDEIGNLDPLWLNCHKQFVSESPSRKLLLAYNVGHTIYAENPALVINVIITQYANFVVTTKKADILERAYRLSLETDNENKKNEVKCGHSEDDITTWGYSYLEKNETEKAIEIFKLNVLLNPSRWNTYDCLGEAYLKAGNKEKAIINYKKSLELNPKNENATKVLAKIK
ncbi:MAG: alpha/beta fold hydrolase [Bacteroidia bacterium]